MEDRDVTRSVLRSGDNFMVLWITVMDEFKGGTKSMTGLEQLAEIAEAV